MRNKIKNLRILITGGAGFIGSHLYESLTKNKNKVIIIDSFINRKRTSFPRAKLYAVDIISPYMKRIFKQERPDLVFHLAGPINLRKKITDPLFSTGLKTIDGFKKILDYSYHYQVKKIIFASSGGAIYENAKIIPTPESYPAHPMSLYGLANLFLEKLLKEYAEAYKLNFSILRLSNVYGPRQWRAGVIPSFIISILENKPLMITGDGTQTRDFIYIDDVVKAFILAANSKKNGVFNVGSSEETSIQKLIQKITEILDVKIKLKYISPKNIEETKRSALDISKIKEELNWEPRYSLEEGLKKTIEWFQTKNKNNRKAGEKPLIAL